MSEEKEQRRTGWHTDGRRHLTGGHWTRTLKTSVWPESSPVTTLRVYSWTRPLAKATGAKSDTHLCQLPLLRWKIKYAFNFCLTLFSITLLTSQWSSQPLEMSKTRWLRARGLRRGGETCAQGPQSVFTEEGEGSLVTDSAGAEALRQPCGQAELPKCTLSRKRRFSWPTPLT